MNKSELQRLFAQLPTLTPQTTWDQHRLDLRQHVANDDIDEFLRWPTVNGTMFVGEAPYIRGEYDDLVASDGAIWANVILEPGIGKPSYLSYDQTTSGNLVHQAYHLKQWVRKTSTDVLDLHRLERVIEIGAGYGAMPLIISRLGFVGDYHLVDSVEFQLLQSYYLRNASEGLYHLDWPADNHCDLLIALFSWSEVPTWERTSFEMTIAESYLIAYQPRWEGVDNHLYFRRFAEYRPSYEWHNFVNPHFGNHWYMIGKRKE